MQQTGFSLLLQFLAEIAHVHLNHVAGRTTFVIPDLRQDLIATHHLASATEQQHEQGILTGRKSKRTRASSHLPATGIHRQIPDPKHSTDLILTALNGQMQSQSLEQVADSQRRQPEIIGARIETDFPPFDTVDVNIQQDRN